MRWILDQWPDYRERALLVVGVEAAKLLTRNADVADAMSGVVHAVTPDCPSHKATVRAVAYGVVAGQA